MPGRQSVLGAQDRRCVAVGDERGEFRCPAVELARDPGGGRGGIGEVDGGEPVLWPGQRHVGVQGVAVLPVSEDLLAWRGRDQQPATDRFRGGWVAGVGVEQVRLDDRRAGVLGCGGGEQWPYP